MATVNRMPRKSSHAKKEFENEVKVASKLQHRNLVRLLGYCSSGEEKLLVYEFLPNKSLDAFLFDATKIKTLDWKKRFNIIEGIAGGLVYLHRDSRWRIIHGDLKASNIFLDEQYNPKISDFGQARIIGGDQIQETTVRNVTSSGYMAPEYAMTGESLEKSDVFSFGVLVLEILSGRSNSLLNDGDQESLGLLQYASKLYEEGRIMQLIDLSLGDSYDKSQVNKCIEVGLSCVQASLTDRPTMSIAVSMLSSEGLGTKKIQGLFLEQYDISMVKKATNYFADGNKLGQGGFGTVYKGTFDGRRTVAVKRLSATSLQGAKEFKSEVEVISKLQHRGLVTLLGYCIHGEEKLLVLEFLPNKSLDVFLFDATKRKTLDWKMRFNIIEGIAGGFVYLHRDSRLRIIHRDLKASNILLDEQYNPKICDFGLARIFGRDQIEEITKRIFGTFGYMAPEYTMAGEFSEKSDVFSFGVLVLETLSGRRSNSLLKDGDQESLCLLQYAWKLWEEERILELIDPSLGDSYDKSQVLKCIKVGLLCVQAFPTDRPTMSMVVSMLSSDTLVPEPKPVAFSRPRGPPESIESTSESYVTAKEMYGGEK